MIERVIASLDGVCALGEVRHLWHRGVRDNELCACGNRFHDCPFWTQVGEIAFGGWHTVDVAAVRALAAEVDRMRRIPAYLASRRRSPQRGLAREYADYFAQVYRAAAQVSGAGVVVDSSKNASTAYALSTHDAIRLRVMHVIRDSRGVAFSWTKAVPRPEAGDASHQPLMDRYAPWQSALLWDAHNAALAVLARRGVPTKRVHYESFIASPVDTTVGIARFLGLDASSATRFVTDSAVIAGPNHQVAGNPIRFATGHIEFRRDDDWRACLPMTSRLAVTALTAPLMAAYGYFGARGYRT